MHSTWTWVTIYYNCPVNQSASPCPEEQVTYLSQVLKLLTHSWVQQLSSWQHLLKVVETFTDTPLISATYVEGKFRDCLLSLAVWCVIADCISVVTCLFHHQSHKANTTIMFNGLMLFTVCDSRHQPWLWLLGGSCVQTGPAKVAKSRECSSSVRIWLRPLGNATYIVCLPLFCQGSKWLSGKNIWLLFRRSWV